MNNVKTVCDLKSVNITIILPVFAAFALLGFAAGLWLEAPEAPAGLAAGGDEAEEVSEDAAFPGGLAELKKKQMPVVICCGSSGYAGKSDMERAVDRVAREYGGRALVYCLNTDTDPCEGLFVPASPTLIFIGSDGSPYIPRENLDLKYGFQLRSDPITKAPLYTYHLGCLNRWDLRALLNDMLEQKQR